MSDEETSSRATRTTTQVLAQQQQDAERDRAERQQVRAQSEDADDNFGAPVTDNRIIQGILLRCVDGRWHDRDKLTVPPRLLALTTFTIVQRWHNQKPEPTIDGRVSSLPDVDELNARIPEHEWEKGIGDKPRPPWQRSEVVYLIEQATAQKYTFASGTVGAQMAVEELRDRVKWMRALRGAKLFPVVELANAPMKTRHGVSKLRPHFKIAGWCGIGVTGKATPLIEHVKPPTTAKELGDEIPF